MYQKFTRSHTFKALGLVLLLLPSLVWGQTYYSMASGNYSETFTAWSGYSTNWNGLAILPTGTIPVATKTTVATTTLATIGSGTAIGYDVATSTKLAFLTTGTTDNAAAVACDLNLNFSGRVASTIAFDAATIFNNTGNRVSSLRLYYSTDGAAWTEITGTSLPYVATNNVAGSASISVALPAALNNQSTVKLRFYCHNGSGGTTGSRPKISIDNVAVSSVCPAIIPAAMTGNWNTASTWSCGGVPASSANVSIPANVTVTLDVAPTINDLSFTGANSRVILGANDLTVNGTITASAATGYIVTDGTGGLIQNLASATAKQFPIGTTTTSFDPASITPTTAAACTFKARVAAAINPAYTLSSKQTGVVTPRQWDIDLQSGSPTVTLDLTSSDLTNAPAANGPAMMGHWNGTTWDDVMANYSNGTWTATGVSAFSPFIVSQALTPLSVTLQSLTLKAKSNMNVLSWQTASEKDNAYFDVQHATNGIDFQSLTQVKGNGTTTAVSNYTYEHADPSVGLHYYRLRQVDANGTASFSKIVSVLSGKKTALSIYPTLATNELHLVTNLDKETDFSIINVYGQTVLSGRINQSTDINIGALTSGHYIVRMGTETARFVKN